MSIKCIDLLALKTFRQIELIAGKTGLTRVITWPHVGQTKTVAEWVHGGELLFITGVIHSVEELEAVLDEGIAKRLAGLVVLVGDEYIKELPDSLIWRADRAAFPLFRMPWNLKLIDVTKEIIDLIMCDKFELKKAESFLGRLLFSSDLEPDDVLELAAVHDVHLGPFCFVALLDIHQKTELILEALQQGDSIEADVQHTLQMLLQKNHISALSTVYGSRIICLISAATLIEARKVILYLKSVHALVLQMHSEIDLYLSLGRIYEGPTEMKRSYREAKQALELCRKIGGIGQIVVYEELGIYRLLFEIKNMEEIRAYYRYNLCALLAHDKANGSSLLATLRQYLYADSNLVKTAQALFIHRNTLVYRLNQIRALLGRDLDSAVVKLDLFNSIVVKDYLGE